MPWRRCRPSWHSCRTSVDARRNCFKLSKTRGGVALKIQLTCKVPVMLLCECLGMLTRHFHAAVKMDVSFKQTHTAEEGLSLQCKLVGSAKFCGPRTLAMKSAAKPMAYCHQSQTTVICVLLWCQDSIDCMRDSRWWIWFAKQGPPVRTVFQAEAGPVLQKQGMTALQSHTRLEMPSSELSLPLSYWWFQESGGRRYCPK